MPFRLSGPPSSTPGMIKPSPLPGTPGPDGYLPGPLPPLPQDFPPYGGDASPGMWGQAPDSTRLRGQRPPDGGPVNHGYPAGVPQDALNVQPMQGLPEGVSGYTWMNNPGPVWQGSPDARFLEAGQTGGYFGGPLSQFGPPPGPSSYRLGTGAGGIRTAAPQGAGWLSAPGFGGGFSRFSGLVR